MICRLLIDRILNATGLVFIAIETFLIVFTGLSFYRVSIDM